MTTEKFGRYEIRSEIGRGGMATVFHAYDPRFERDVAIKVLPREFLHDPQFRARFEREAKTIALLEHPAIVPVYDFGEEEGQPYIVMRYMSGGSLSERLHQGPMTLDETIQLMTRLAPALDAAHSRGIIHRDMKPGNILYDQYGNSFLSDFGIARLAQAGAATLTGGNILGTPAYMSPEQVQGDKEIDGRSDIYALGVILFQVLTGNAPYQATTPARVMMMHILEPVPNILDSGLNVPSEIQQIIERAMAKDPNDRYPTSTAMAADLNEVALTSTPARSRPPTSATVVSRPLRQPGQESGTLTPSAPGGVTSTAARQPRRAVATEVGGAPIAIPKPAALKRSIPIWIWVVGFIVVVGLMGAAAAGGAALLLGKATQTPAAIVQVASPTVRPSNTPRPSHTPEPPSPTPEVAVVIPTETPAPLTDAPTEIPTATATETPLPPTPTEPATALVLGGSDKIAFFNANNVWAANLDGSDLVQLTRDGAEKTELQWLPDGEALTYISGKCVYSVRLSDGRVDQIMCLDTAAYLDSFSVSPDGKTVAISVDHEHIYIIPFDREALSQARTRNNLRAMGACEAFSPLISEFFKIVRWSDDGQKLAFVFAAPVAGRREDTIRTIDLSNCSSPPARAGGYVDFPANFFTIAGYNDNPSIYNFGWDGSTLFAMTGTIRNGSFGDLYIFNTELNRADLKINPINNNCCYRDPSWSPDGRYLALAYQAITESNKIELYLIPYGTIGTGAQYTPILLPEDFFANRRSSPQPVLRPMP